MKIGGKLIVTKFWHNFCILNYILYIFLNTIHLIWKIHSHSTKLTHKHIFVDVYLSIPHITNRQRNTQGNNSPFPNPVWKPPWKRHVNPKADHKSSSSLSQKSTFSKSNHQINYIFCFLFFNILFIFLLNIFNIFK